MRYVVLNIPDQEPALLPTDEEVHQQYKNYANVDNVFIVSYDRSLSPTEEESQRSWDNGSIIAGGVGVLLKKEWKKRNYRVKIHDIQSTTWDINDLTTNSRILIIGELGEQQTTDGQTEPVLFGNNGTRHTVKELADKLTPLLEKIGSTVFKWVHINFYYKGFASTYAVQLINRLAMENMFVCIRMKQLEGPRTCVFYFNKLALRQFQKCPV
jgi:hypothetical protein